MPVPPETLNAFSTALAEYQAAKAALAPAKARLQAAVDGLGSSLAEGEVRAVNGAVPVVRKSGGVVTYEVLKGLADS
jgi:hypothetical protein